MKLALYASLVFSVVGCSPAPMPVSQSSKDPSSPNAPDGVNPMSVAIAEPHAHTHATSEGVVYVCPMHPEVTSTTEGSVCPKCNMKLVPKK